jgi:hypothetical protein
MAGSKYVIEQMHKLDKVMTYKGIIYLWENKLRPMYVWQKNKNDTLVSLNI